MDKPKIVKNAEFIKNNIADALIHVPFRRDQDGNSIQRLSISSTADGEIKYLGPSSDTREKLTYSQGIVFYAENGLCDRIEYRPMEAFTDMGELELTQTGHDTLKGSLQLYNAYLKKIKNRPRSKG